MSTEMIDYAAQKKEMSVNEFWKRVTFWLRIFSHTIIGLLYPVSALLFGAINSYEYAILILLFFILLEVRKDGN